MDKDDLLGTVEVPLDALLSGKTVDIWLKLKLDKKIVAQLRKADKAGTGRRLGGWEVFLRIWGA